MYTEKINIILADDHVLVRTALKELLDGISFIDVIDETADGIELIKAYFRLKPDVVVTDIFMPNLNGIEALRRIKKEDITVKVLFLSAYDNEEYIYEALIAGALGFVNKSISLNKLLTAIKRISRGEKYYPGFTDKELNEVYEKYNSLFNSSSDSSDVKTTNMEHKILRLLGEGLTSEMIANRLNVSKRTIDNHRAHLMKKLKFKNGTELLRYAIHYNKIHYS